MEPWHQYDAVIICEDIRREDNGKAILIGVINQEIIFKQLPGKAALRFWGSGRYTRSATVKSELRWQMGEKTLASLNATFEGAEGEDFISATPRMMLAIKSKGELELQEREDEGPWRTLKKLKISEKKPSTT